MPGRSASDLGSDVDKILGAGGRPISERRWYRAQERKPRLNLRFSILQSANPDPPL